MFETILVIVFVVISVLSELNKNKEKKDGEDLDLQSLEDFFKGKRTANPPDTESVSTEQGDKEFHQVEPPPFNRSESSSEMESYPGSASTQVPEPFPGSGLPPLPEPSPRKKEKKKKVKSTGKPSAQHQPREHISDEGPCLDNAPALTGHVNYNKMAFGAISATAHSSFDTQSGGERRPNWNRRRLIDAIVMAELLQRYDLSRVFGRIPPVRSSDRQS